MSDQPAHAVYTKLLLRRRHGYPLWIPESDSNLPDVVRNKGVSVGDLGILTDDGGFDFLFNVCAEADDPANRGYVPPQFQPLRISSSHAIRKIPGFHCRKSSITSAHVSRTTITVEGSAEMTPFVTGGGGFEFSTSKAEAAILMLPDGGNRYDTRHRSLFEKYAYENGLSWYEYVNGLDHLAQSAPNGSLYLVTGCDKARSWMTAAASCPSKSHTISAKFAIGPILEGRIALHASWSTPHIEADTRVCPDYPDPMPQQDNQCVFMRGFTITVRENSIMQKVLGPVQLKVIGGSSRNSAPSFSSRSLHSSYQDTHVGSSSSRVLSSTSPVDNFDTTDHWTHDDPKSLLNDVELNDLPGRSTELLNPSAKINEHILTLHPLVTVAITHDEDWMEVTKDLPPDEWPDNCTLASMVLEKRSDIIPIEEGEGHPHHLDEDDMEDEPDSSYSNGSVSPLSHASPHGYSINEKLPRSTLEGSQDVPFPRPRQSSDTTLTAVLPPSFGARDRSASVNGHQRHLSPPTSPFFHGNESFPFNDFLTPPVYQRPSQPSSQVNTDIPFEFCTPPPGPASPGLTHASYASSPFVSPEEYRPQSSGDHSDHSDLSVVSPPHESNAVDNPYRSSSTLLLHPEDPRGRSLWRFDDDYLTPGSNSRSLGLASMSNLDDLDHDFLSVMRSPSVAPGTHSESGIDSSDILAHFDLNPSVSTSDIFGDIAEQKTSRLATDASLSPTSYQEQVASDVAQASQSRQTNAANYTCPECHQTFTAKHNLNNHLNSHYGVRNFRCEFPNCNKSFGTSHVRRRHMLVCHSESAEAKKRKPRTRLSSFS